MDKFFNDSLDQRYNTLIGTIKMASNTFYDSYLDLLEATVKYFLDENNIIYDDSRTCGYLVKEESIKEFLLTVLKIDNKTYEKLPDYIKKCNDHKHKKEKNLGIDSIVNYLKVYYDFVNYYIDYVHGVKLDYDANYFSSIFGETERLNKEYKEEVLKLKEELKESVENNKLSEQDIKKYKSLVSIKDIELFNLDEQNQKLQNQISVLKDIKLSSMEEKLNKTLELLMNLTNSVVENRAVSIAIGESIIGKDITKTEYMNKAKKIIEENNQNLFDKINANSLEISNLSRKFDKVDVDDLCKLAERTLKTADFDGAKKIYNQVLLLNPNDWKAEYYVTALNLYGSHYHTEFAVIINNRYKLYEKTFENIMNLKTSDEKKIDALTEAINIVEKDVGVCISHTSEQRKKHIESLDEAREKYDSNPYYAKNKTSFEEAYSYLLEDVYEKSYLGVECALLSIMKSINKLPYKQFRDKNKRFAEMFMNYVNELELIISDVITEEDLNNIVSLSNIPFKYEYTFAKIK